MKVAEPRETLTIADQGCFLRHHHVCYPCLRAIDAVMRSPNTVQIHGSGLSWQIGQPCSRLNVARSLSMECVDEDIQLGTIIENPPECILVSKVDERCPATVESR